MTIFLNFFYLLIDDDQSSSDEKRCKEGNSDVTAISKEEQLFQAHNNEILEGASRAARSVFARAREPRISDRENMLSRRPLNPIEQSSTIDASTQVRVVLNPDPLASPQAVFYEEISVINPDPLASPPAIFNLEDIGAIEEVGIDTVDN